MNYSDKKKKIDTIKEGYKNSDEPKIKKKDRGEVLKIVIHAIKLIVIAVLFFIFNGSIVFLIKEASDAVLNKILPSKCEEPPYGSAKVHPCKDPEGWTKSATKKIIKLLEGGEDLPNYVEDEQSKDNIGNNCNIGASYPYKWYRKDPDDILHNYINWFLNSLARTQTNLHGSIKGFMKWLNSTPFSTNSILIVISLIMLLLVLPIIKLYILFSLIIRQITTFWKHGVFAMILIIFTGFFIGIFDIIISSFNTLKIFFELAIKPLFNSEQREIIMNIVKGENVVIGYILGFMFLQILYKIKMNKHIEKPVKIIPTVIFYLILVIHLIKYIYNLFSKVGGNQSSKCR
jgi:hypothetical protein